MISRRDLRELAPMLARGPREPHRVRRAGRGIGIAGEAAGAGSDYEERHAAGIVIFGVAEADNEQ